MEQLTVLDAGFLEAEDSDPHISMAIGAVAILDGPMPEADVVTAVLAQRALCVPRLRQILHTQPLDLGAPYWVDDQSFAAAHHVRHVALPRPGDEAALHRMVADVMERRLDRDRPLWECWVVDGLQDGRWAVVMKVHHCVADGIAASRLLSRLCDDRDEAVPATGVGTQPIRIPSWYNPLEWVAGAWRLSMGLPSAAAQAVRGVAGIAAGLVIPAARSLLVGPVTSMRHYAAVEVPLTDVTRVSEAFDVTVNDVALAAVTEGFRAVMIARGEEPREDSLRTLVPVSTRTDAAREVPDNRVSVMLPYLPVDQADPIYQLRTVHSRLARTKAGGGARATSLLLSAVNAVPFAVTAWAVRTLTKLPQRGVVTLATNVPGPRKPLQFMGCDVTRLLPIPPLGMQLRTSVAIMSYADRLSFGVIGDYDSAPDVDDLADGIGRAVTRLAALSTGHWRSTPVGTLQLVHGESAQGR